MNILVNAPTGQQEIIPIGAGGGYFDPARVIWDERVDGPLPKITLGVMKRVGNSLTIDDSMKPGALLVQKEILISELTNIAKQKRNAGVTVNGLYVATDSDGRSLLLIAQYGGKPNRKNVAKTGRAILTKIEVDARLLVVDDYLQEVSDNQYDLEEAIEVAADQIVLDAIDISAGWPA